MTAELDFDVQFVATDVGTDAERAQPKGSLGTGLVGIAAYRTDACRGR